MLQSHDRHWGIVLCLLLAAGCTAPSATSDPTILATPAGPSSTAAEPSSPKPTFAPPPFTVGQVIEIPPTPLVGDIAVADLNGDGAADLAVCNEALPTLSVVAGNGDATFETARAVDLDSSCISVIAADLDGDVDMDLATANQDGTASVLIGAGDGTFGAPMSYAIAGDLAPAPAWMIAATELNSDGPPDLVATVFNFDLGFTAPGHLAVLLSEGGGTFASAVFYPDQSAVAVATGDLNGDGKNDVVSASGDRNVRVYPGDGTGALAPAAEYQLGGAGVAVAIDDFNGDGLPDLAIGEDAGYRVDVLLAKPDGTLGEAQGFAAGNTHTIAVADLNGDGLTDLLAGGYNEHFVRAWLSQGDGTFGPEGRIDTGNALVVAMAVYDFNGDRHDDLAVADGVSAIHIFLR